jgi:hypothetical protein
MRVEVFVDDPDSFIEHPMIGLAGWARFPGDGAELHG